MEILTGNKGYSEIENVRILHMTNPRQGYNVKKFFSNYQTIWFCAIYNCNPNTIFPIILKQAIETVGFTCTDVISLVNYLNVTT